MARSSAFSSSFNEAEFRSAILDAMRMGIPEDPAERLTWYWERDRQYVPEDPAHRPYDWSQAATTDTPGNPALPDAGADQGLSVPYALEFQPRRTGAAATSLGDIDTSRVVVTLLDNDFERVRTADYVLVGDTRYRILFHAPAQGLFGVTVWEAHLEAEGGA